MLTAEQVTIAVNAINDDRLSFWDFLYFNNPVSMIYCLRNAGLTNKAIPTNENVVPVLNRMISRKDMNLMSEIVSSFEFDKNAKNFTSNAGIWEALGLPVGDVKGLFNKVYKLS